MLLSKVFLIISVISLILSANDIKQTPEKVNYYKVYVSYLNTTKNIPISKIFNTLNSRDNVLGFYESILKSTYNIYQKESKSKSLNHILGQLSKVKKLDNTLEGLIYMDMKLSIGEIPDQKISSIYFCKVRFGENTKLSDSCINDYIIVNFLHKDKDISLLQLTKNKKEVLEFINKF